MQFPFSQEVHPMSNLKLSLRSNKLEKFLSQGICWTCPSRIRWLMGSPFKITSSYECTFGTLQFLLALMKDTVRWLSSILNILESKRVKKNKTKNKTNKKPTEFLRRYYSLHNLHTDCSPAVLSCLSYNIPFKLYFNSPLLHGYTPPRTQAPLLHFPGSLPDLLNLISGLQVKKPIYQYYFWSRPWACLQCKFQLDEFWIIIYVELLDE